MEYKPMTVDELDPIIVELEDGSGYLVEARVTPDQAREIAWRAAGGRALDSLHAALVTGPAQLTYMRHADDQAPVGLRSEPYWMECSAGDRGACTAWKVSVGVKRREP